MAPWRWPESNRLRQRLQGAPATLAVTPASRLRHHVLRPAVFMVLTLWTCQLSSLYERLFGTVSSSRSKRKPPRWDFSLGRLPVSACSRLPGDHSAGQGSRKPRHRIHVSGSLRRLASGHASMVRRRPETGQLYFRRILRVTARRRLQGCWLGCRLACRSRGAAHRSAGSASGTAAPPVALTEGRREKTE